MKKKLNSLIYASLYDRIELMARVMGIDQDVIVNARLLNGMIDEWKEFTDIMKEFEQSKSEGMQLKDLKTEIDILADEYMAIAESLNKYDYQERFVDENFDFSSISEDLEFRKEYFSEKTKRKPHSDK